MWLVLFFILLFLVVSLLLLKFRKVYIRNQYLQEHLPVSGKVHWLFGGRVFFLLRCFLKGKKGLSSMVTESLKASEELGPIYVA